MNRNRINTARYDFTTRELATVESKANFERLFDDIKSKVPETLQAKTPSVFLSYSLNNYVSS